MHESNSNSTSLTIGELLVQGHPDIRKKLLSIQTKLSDIQDLGWTENWLELTVDQAFERLQTIRESIPDTNHSEPNESQPFTRLDAALIPLYHLKRTMDVIGPLDRPSDYIDPSAYDVLISDIKPHELPEIISDVLGTPYLAPATVIPSPIRGRIYGRNRRVLFTIPVSHSQTQKSVSVHFIFDTGAPTSYIAQSTMDALGITESDLSRVPVRLNGKRAYVSVSDTTKAPDGESPCHFVGLNLLGMDYLDRINARFSINFEKEQEALIEFD